MGASQSRIVGYFCNWSAYRDGNDKCRYVDIDDKLCTHYIWCFLKIQNNKVTFDNSSDENDLRTFARCIRLNGSHAKVMASVGGWTYSRSSEFETMVASISNRNEFTKSVLNLMSDYELDGIDIDWEFPGQSDRDNFAEFIQGLSLSCHSVGKEVSVAVAGSTTIAHKAYDIPRIIAHADFINLMTYDLHGSWEDWTNHHAGWLGYGYVRAAILYWIGRNCPKHKLVVGIPTFGRTWTLRHSSSHAVGAQASGSGIAGSSTKESGVLAYFEILDNFNKQDWNKKFDSHVQSPYAYYGDQWISYENIKSAQIKAKYIKKQELGGAMFWSLDMDDFHGNHGETFPIVKAVKRILQK